MKCSPGSWTLNNCRQFVGLRPGRLALLDVSLLNPTGTGGQKLANSLLVRLNATDGATTS